MFDVGDYIVYGNNGVCLVEKVGPLESSVMSKEKIYYTLSPCYMQGSTIFTPADNQKSNDASGYDQRRRVSFN